MSQTPQWDLLNKTELRIERIELRGADLTEVARTVAAALGLPPADVVVIDARDDVLALDILTPVVDAYGIAGRQEHLLTMLGGVPGVGVDEATSVCAEGVLGWIAADERDALEALDRARMMAKEIEQTIAGRAIVFSTGPEVLSGQIRDTNKPWIAAHLRKAGFTVTTGSDLPDDRDAIASAMREAGEELGYGLIITTGGVGAEGKDTTVEALISVGRSVATPTLFAVDKGHHRHAKSEVRIGIGEVGTAIAACLPGPHEEATLGATALTAALAINREPAMIAEAVASALRQRLRSRHREAAK